MGRTLALALELLAVIFSPRALAAARDPQGHVLADRDGPGGVVHEDGTELFPVEV